MATLTTALGAFLLFFVQPLAGRALLPALGGSAGVWTTCLLFFQAVLLLGYAYAHGLTRLSARVATAVHALVLLGALAHLPLRIALAPSGTDAPLGSLLWSLIRGVGLPYFALAATTPLLESVATSELSYRRYAYSNAASIAALLVYPLAVEPRFSLPVQQSAWSLGFVAYACVLGATLWRGRRASISTRREHVANGKTHTLWIALAAAASLLLVTTTSQLSTCIAPVPLLWIVPLVTYLGSFVLTFRVPAAYRRGIFLFLAAPSLAVLGMDVSLIELGPIAKVALVTASLGVACTTAHGELVRMRPPEGLTAYYLAMAFGGALGAAIAAVLAPLALRTHAERPLASVALAVLLGASMLRDGRDVGARSPRLTVLGLSAFFVLALGASGRSVATDRNFYGAIRVVDKTEPYGRERRMIHGGIIHGVESLDPTRTGEPMSYFTRASGLARAIAVRGESGPVRFGVVGLGIGSSLEYLRPGDTARVFELDPLVVEMARAHFTILSRHDAQTTVVVGDGRAALAKEPENAFDVLALDAFSGDAVPTHLLTRQAFSLYAERVAPGGFLCVHITNLYVNLEPVIREAARGLGWHAASVISPADDRGGKRSHWILLHRDADAFRHPLFGDAQPLSEAPPLAAWTDDFSSVWRVLRL